MKMAQAKLIMLLLFHCTMFTATSHFFLDVLPLLVATAFLTDKAFIQLLIPVRLTVLLGRNYTECAIFALHLDACSFRQVVRIVRIRLVPLLFLLRELLLRS